MSDFELSYIFQDQVRSYNHKEYEDYMFHFNTERRTSHFMHDIVGTGLDHCFDCMSEIFILGIFLEKFRGLSPGSDEMRTQIAKMSQDLSAAISNSGRTLKLDLWVLSMR